MSQKLPKCYQCGGVFTRRIAPPHQRKLRYEGTSHDVLVTDMPEWHCEACNLSVTDEEGDEPLQAALRKHMGLLTPQQIKAGIKELGMTQEKFAEKIRCAPESISRWLNGVVLQSRVYDCLMRIYFHFPEVRGALDQFTPDTEFGRNVVQPSTANEVATGWPTAGSLSSAVFGSEVAPAFPDAFELPAGKDVAWQHGAEATAPVFVSADFLRRLTTILLKHSQSAEVRDRGPRNRLQNFDWSVVCGEVAG